MTTIQAEPTERATVEPAPVLAPGYAQHKANQLSQLHKIDGQVRGVTRMVEQDGYCIDVLTQISAVTRAWQEVALGLAR